MKKVKHYKKTYLGLETRLCLKPLLPSIICCRSYVVCHHRRGVGDDMSLSGPYS